MIALARPFTEPRNRLGAGRPSPTPPRSPYWPVALLAVIILAELVVFAAGLIQIAKWMT